MFKNFEFTNEFLIKNIWSYNTIKTILSKQILILVWKIHI